MWKPTENDLYMVNEIGQVLDKGRNRILPQQIDKYGYNEVTFTRGNKKDTAKVHQLVAKAFVPNPNGYETVNHKDMNKQNNRAENLEWLPNEENVRRENQINSLLRGGVI